MQAITFQPSESVEPADVQPEDIPISVIVVPVAAQSDDQISPASTEVLSESFSSEIDALSSAMSETSLISESSSRHTNIQKHRKGKMSVPIDTANLRRSNRSTKYDGFRVPQPSDSRQQKSKVKPRLIPSAATAASQHTSAEQASDAQELAVPPPTPIATMQAVGTQLCAIPAEELSDAALTKGPEDSTSSA